MPALLRASRPSGSPPHRWQIEFSNVSPPPSASPSARQSPSNPLDAQVLVVGAGPAGGDLARRLARRGIEVILLDQLADLRAAAFSSAALPMAAVDRFSLPAKVVASRWHGWQVIGPWDRRRRWDSRHPMGAVLDFGALRCWLATECRDWGARVELGSRAVGCREVEGGVLTAVRDRHGRSREIRTAWVVDATGQTRVLLGEPTSTPKGSAGNGSARHGLITGEGVEWLLQVPAVTWRRWSDRLSFCLGTGWVPQGYGWIFPMQPGILKLGVCRLRDARHRQPALGQLLHNLFTRLLDASERRHCTVLDRHGGLIRSTIGRHEDHLRGRLIGLGDVVSTANLLGGEGIRHALAASEVLAPLLAAAIDTDPHEQERDGVGSSRNPLRRYRHELDRVLGCRWPVTGRLARHTWLGLQDERADRRMDRLLSGLEGRRAEDLSALLFDYRFERYGLRALRYLLGWG